jgi:hypothetical protein
MRLVELLHEDMEQQHASSMGGVLKGDLASIYIIIIKQTTLAM